MPKIARRDGRPVPKSSRAVYLGTAFQHTPVYDRASLPTGKQFDGPAIIEEFGSTTVVFPGQIVEADPHGILVIRPAKPAHEVKS
jgi:N-methylhydantoinase A